MILFLKVFENRSHFDIMLNILSPSVWFWGHFCILFVVYFSPPRARHSIWIIPKIFKIQQCYIWMTWQHMRISLSILASWAPFETLGSGLSEALGALSRVQIFISRNYASDMTRFKQCFVVNA